MEPEAVDALIETQAAEPANVSANDISIANRPISELLALQDQLKANAAAAKPGCVLKFSRLIPPGGAS